MQLKAEANTEPRKKYHMMSRVKKALHYAEEFASLCESPKCDARTKLECQVKNVFIKIEFTAQKVGNLSTLPDYTVYRENFAPILFSPFDLKVNLNPNHEV